jgi:hypothetical protein
MDDVFLHWKLRGSLDSGPVPAAVNIPLELRNGKSYVYGQLVDFDSVVPSNLDRFDFAVTTRSAFASVPPSNWRNVASTRSYELWRRSGKTVARSIPAERGSPGGLLSCTPPMRSATGVAAVRTRPVVLEGGAVPSGSTTVRWVRLPPGVWQISMQYMSPVTLRIAAPGLRVQLPATLDRMGPFWRVGNVDGGRTMKIAISADRAPFIAPRRSAAVNAITAVRLEKPRMLALAAACGKYVDWYRVTTR